MPAIVRGCSERLKRSRARSILSCAFVGTARTWRGLRGARGPVPQPHEDRLARLGLLPVRVAGLVASRLAVLGLGRRLSANAVAASRRARHAPAEATPLRLPLGLGGRVGRRGLTDPALALRVWSAQLADESPLTRRRQVGLRPFALEHRAMTDVAGGVLLDLRQTVHFSTHNCRGPAGGAHPAGASETRASGLRGRLLLRCERPRSPSARGARALPRSAAKSIV